LSSEELNSQKIFDSAFRTIQKLIEDYDGSEPLVRYLKNNFRANKKYGSRDRKLYTAWVFCWFRLGKNLTTLPFNERIALAWYVCHGWNSEISKYAASKYFSDSLNSLPNTDELKDRVNHVKKIYPEFDIKLLFPFDTELSDHIPQDDFYYSHVHQPLVWIRPFPGIRDTIIHHAKMQGLNIVIKDSPMHAIGFPPGFNIESLPFSKGTHYEIQDLSSQLCGLSVAATHHQLWWDCCCGAGGKSLQLLERIPDLQIHATDIRSSILDNFRERLPAQFKKQVTMAVADLSVSGEFDSGRLFDGILADVPCSGSGTWARNPENLTFFQEEKLAEYRQRQEKIVVNAIPNLKSGGYLVYMTCSVFKLENEGMVAFILQNSDLKLVQNEIVCGCLEGADSMFYAIFRKG
jgi:16S rRNA (cytosine967-C5)-methyltransferase